MTAAATVTRNIRPRSRGFDIIRHMKTTMLLVAVCIAALGRADVPPAPGPESWTFKEDLARPVRYHAPEAYQVDDQYGLSGDMETVAADLARFMASAKSQCSENY